MKSQNIWLSYDLGIKGDYPSLYAWLDNHNAKESGNSVAFFKYFYTSDLVSELGQDLEEHVDFDHGDRIYIVLKTKKDGEVKTLGKFIVGKRKSNPWKGYGDKGEDVIDGDE